MQYLIASAYILKYVIDALAIKGINVEAQIGYQVGETIFF
jgi:hypothetical protein